MLEAPKRRSFKIHIAEYPSFLKILLSFAANGNAVSFVKRYYPSVLIKKSWPTWEPTVKLTMVQSLFKFNAKGARKISLILKKNLS